MQNFKRIPLEKLEPTGPRLRDSGDLIRYCCMACRFRFSRKADFQFENCPSCGKSGAIKKEVSLTTNRLLEESGDFFS